MARPRKGVIPPQFRKFTKKKNGGKRKAMPAFLKRKLGRKRG